MIDVSWLETGQPFAVDASGRRVQVSLSHDDRVSLCVAGDGPQGCDVAPVGERTRPEWLALLGARRESLLDALIAAGDTLDRAGTRIWSAAEAVKKATGAAAGELKLERADGDAVLVRSGETLVLTFPLELTRGPERVAAIVVEGLRVTETQSPEPAGAGAPAIEQYGHDPSEHSISVAGEGPTGQPVFALRFPLTFRETANLSRTLYFSHYFVWIGKLREVVCRPVADRLAADFSTGRWGMVTNSASTRILRPLTSDDVVEGRVWLDELSGPHASTQDLGFEWRRLLRDGGSERVAWSTMRATWVEILDHGVVEARPLPEYFDRFLAGMGPAGGRVPPPEAEAPEAIELGPLLYAAPPGPVNKSLLYERVFDSSLEDANLVGNIYFANYYRWQGRTRDEYFRSLAPELYRGTGERGELRCLHCKIEHLREAMPFDPIAVRMSLDALNEQGVRLRFDYFRVNPDGGRDKLGSGEHVAGWFAPATGGDWLPAPMPDVFRDILMEKAARADS
jgi:acyl-CoA thioesterase FadM